MEKRGKKYDVDVPIRTEVHQHFVVLIFRSRVIRDVCRYGSAPKKIICMIGFGFFMELLPVQVSFFLAENYVALKYFEILLLTLLVSKLNWTGNMYFRI